MYVELLLPGLIFGKRLNVGKPRMRLPCHRNHLRADVQAHAVTGLECVEKKPRLAANVQDALAGLDQVTEQAFETFVVIPVPPNPLGPGPSPNGLMLPVALILQLEGPWTQAGAESKPDAGGVVMGVAGLCIGLRSGSKTTKRLTTETTEFTEESYGALPC